MIIHRGRIVYLALKIIESFEGKMNGCCEGRSLQKEGRRVKEMTENAVGGWTFDEVFSAAHSSEKKTFNRERCRRN